MLDAILHSTGTEQRRALAKAITLLESSRADHRAQVDAMLGELLPHTGAAVRIGISGVPGVGKSTLIENLGLHLIAQGHKVAVLAVDPSSSVSGGSILGDKTRMERLSTHEHAFIRPSPSRGTLGGVAASTREAVLVCEAAGYDVVLVETVGVGQSETAVAGMTDCFVLLQLPNAGDELQAIKRGVMELADLIVINKADLDARAATRAQAQFASTLRLIAPWGVLPPLERVLQISAVQGDGVATLWQRVQQFMDAARASGQLRQRRREQTLAAMWERIHAGLRRAFEHHAGVQRLLPQMQSDVLEGRVAPGTAAEKLLLVQAQPAATAMDFVASGQPAA